MLTLKCIYAKGLGCQVYLIDWHKAKPTRKDADEIGYVLFAVRTGRGKLSFVSCKWDVDVSRIYFMPKEIYWIGGIASDMGKPVLAKPPHVRRIEL